MSLLDNMVDVFVHVALKDGVEGTKKPHEALSINFGDLNISLSHHIRSPWLRLEEGSLPKVVRWSILFDFSGWGTWLKRLCGNRVARDEQVEVVTFFSLINDRCTRCKVLLLDCIRYLAPLVVVHGLQDRH